MCLLEHRYVFYMSLLKKHMCAFVDAQKVELVENFKWGRLSKYNASCSPASPTSQNKPPCAVAYAPLVQVVLPWMPRGGLEQRGRLARAAVRPKPRFLVWRSRGRKLRGGCLLEISSRRCCQAIPVVPPRPVAHAKLTGARD